MYHCLNQRRGNTYETASNEQTTVPEKLQKRNTRSQEKSTHHSNEGRRTSVTFEPLVKFDTYEEHLAHLWEVNHK